MTHDPFCPEWEDGGSTVCLCRFIARIREDERDNCWSAVAEIYPDELFNGVKTAWWIEKEAALAAIDALRGYRYSDSHQPQVDGTEAHRG